MSGRVLIAYDGSDEARHAVRRARELVTCGEALVLHVYASPHAPVAIAGPVLPVTTGVTETARREAEQRAAAVAREGCEIASAAGFRASHLCRAGSGSGGVAATIVQAAEEHAVDMIVVAARDRARIVAALLGSVEDSVVHSAPCPVLVVPAGDG